MTLNSVSPTVLILSLLISEAMSGPEPMYSPSRLVRLLHQVPHVNITLHRLEDPSFRPDSDLYKETLGLMGAVPAACLLLTLTTLTTYLCCCNKKDKVTFSKTFIYLLRIM